MKKAYQEYTVHVDEEAKKVNSEEVLAFAAVTVLADPEASNILDKPTAHVITSLQGSAENIAQALLTLYKSARKQSPVIEFKFMMLLMQELNGRTPKEISIEEYKTMKKTAENVVNEICKRNTDV